MKKLYALLSLFIFLNPSIIYADGAIFVPVQHSDLLGVGTNTHETIDTFIASKGQPGGLAALNGSGTINGAGLIAQVDGTGTGNQLTNIQIISGTGTLSGVASPFIAQVNGTSTGGSHTAIYIAGSSTIQSTSSSDSFMGGNFGVGTTTPKHRLSIITSQIPGHTTYTDTQALIENNGNTYLELASNAGNAGGFVFSDEDITGALITYSHILNRLAIYVNQDIGTLTSPQFTINSSGSVSASNLITSWKAGGTEGYGQLNFVSTGDIAFTPTYDNSSKTGTITAGLTGTASSKPNLLQDEVLKANAPGTLTFNSNFHVGSTGSITVRNLVQQTNGTASGTHITAIQIVSGTGTLSGVEAPYIAQTNGTGTNMTVGSVSVSHNGAIITGGDIANVDMCFGDNDTGINWVADGKIQLKTNSNIIATLDSSGSPSTFDIGSSSHNANVTHYGTFSCKNQIESQAGGFKFPDGSILLSAVDLSSGNDNFVKMLLHADQIGSLSTYTDASEQELTITSVGGTNGTTTEKVFGDASFAFGGTSDRLQIADNTRLELGSNDFFIDFRVRFTSFTGSSYLVSKEQTAATDYILFGYNSSANELFFQQEVSNSFIVNVAGSWTASLNTWYHVGLARKGSKYRFYIDGSQKGSDATDADPITDNSGVWAIGGVPSDTTSFYGYIDEFRMSIGTGRKPAGTFTVPLAAYGTYTFNN